jgi:hypothetical protein
VAWDQDGTALAAAFDLLQGDYSRAPRAARQPLRTQLRWAAASQSPHCWSTCGATVLSWGSLRYRDWQAQRDVVATARNAGVADAKRCAASGRALSARHATPPSRGTDRELRRLAAPRACRAVARAAARGTLKSATYAANTWTLDLGKVDPRCRDVDRNLAAAGLTTLTATTPAGTRMRIGP